MAHHFKVARIRLAAGEPFLGEYFELLSDEAKEIQG